MKSIKLLIVFIIFNFSFCFSQNAEDIFHFAGNLYINGNNKGAKIEIDKGLQLYPNNPKLTALRNKIKDEEEKQQKKQNEDQMENQDKKQEEQNQQNNQQQKDQQSQQQNQQDKNKKDSQQAQPYTGQISKEDAERLLNALEQQEKDVLYKLDKEKAKNRKTPAEKEW